MKCLLLGYSRIAQKRIIPAMTKSNIRCIDVASRTRASGVVFPKGITGQVFSDYDIALAQSDADLAYISTVNSTHALWAEKALNRGMHVIVDKPAFTHLDDARHLADLSGRNNLCLAEATVFAYHPAVQAIRDAFLSADSQPTHIIATFSFPPLTPENFRYRRELGGGALWDVGPYAVVPGRIFFAREPEEICCRITDWDNEVETSFSLMMTYSGGHSLVGHFGFNTGYCNRLELLGSDMVVSQDRIFTLPADMATPVHIRQGNQSKTIVVPPADSFSTFFREVIRAIDKGQVQSFAEEMMLDALVLHRMRKACNQ